MNLLILHISDMHFRKKNSFSAENVNAIVNALRQSITGISDVLVVVSGDIAHSGQKGECIEARRFFSSIEKTIREKYAIESVDFAFVPGNHDIDYKLGDIRRQGLEELKTSADYDAVLEQELDKQKQFFVLAKVFGSFETPGLFNQKSLSYGGKTIQLNLLNTAVFSSLDEDQGFHYLPASIISKLSAQNNSDFVITIMHHPHHWFMSGCKKALEEALYSRSDIIFVGHEHYESSMKIEHSDASVDIFAAGKLSDRGDWANSEFHAGVLNLDTRTYTSKKFHWNEEAKLYVEEETRAVTLSRNRYNQLGLIVRPEFHKALEEDKYTQFNHVMEYSYSGLNADILLFVTYITDNLNIIKMVMEQGRKSVQDWMEFDLKSIDIPFLVNPVEQIVKPYEDGDREKAEEDRIEQEKSEVQAMAIANDASIFYGEDQELNFVQKIIRSISLMIILARTLPSFEHMMKKEDKDACVDMLYRMPLQVFEAWCKEIDTVSGELIADIKEFHEREYRKERPNVPPLEDKEALYILKWEATSLLLDLMYACMNNATRDNTNTFLDEYSYQSQPAYSIEHLISLARRDSVTGFSSEVEDLFDSEKQPLTRTIIQRVTHNYMVNSKRIRPAETQRLNAKIFNQGLKQDRLIVEQKKNREKE